MSEIKNGGLDHHGKVLSLNGIGGERVNFMHFSSQWPVTLEKSQQYLTISCQQAMLQVSDRRFSQYQTNYITALTINLSAAAATHA